MVQIIVIHNSLDKTNFNPIVSLMNTRTIITHKYSMIHRYIYLFKIISKLVTKQKSSAINTILIFCLFIVQKPCKHIFLKVFLFCFCAIQLRHCRDLRKGLCHLKACMVVVWNLVLRNTAKAMVLSNTAEALVELFLWVLVRFLSLQRIRLGTNECVWESTTVFHTLLSLGR